MLLDNEKHKRWHTLGPKEIHWGEKAVATLSMTRSTIDSEQVTINVPVFQDDTRQTLEDRIGMFYSISQDRMDDANEAWKAAALKEREANPLPPRK